MYPNSYVKSKQLRQAQQQLDSIQQQRIAVENDITVNEKLLAEAQKATRRARSRIL